MSEEKPTYWNEYAWPGKLFFGSMAVFLVILMGSCTGALSYSLFKEASGAKCDDKPVKAICIDFIQKEKP